MPTSTANITAKAARSRSTDCAPTSGAADFSAGGGARRNSHREDFNAGEQEASHYQVTQERRALERRGRLHPSAHATRPISSRDRRQAARILFEGKRAVGVDTARASNFARSARARVILSSGAFHTPHLLMLSRRRRRRGAAKHGIATVHHLSGVGQNLQDHPDFIFGYTRQSELYRDIVQGPAADISRHRTIPS